MKILQTISYYAPAWGYGGPPKVMYELARRHVRNGHEVTVFTTDTLDASSRVNEPETVMEGIRVRRFRNVSNRLAWHYKKFIAPEFGRALAREIDRFDVVHVSDSRGWITLQTYRHARAASIPLVLSAFGSLGRSEGLRALIKKFYDVRYLTPMIRSAALLVAQTRHEADEYLSFGADPKRIIQIPLGVTPSEFATMPVRGSFRRTNGFRENDRIILFIGRIHALKGLDFLIDVLARLRLSDNTWRLVIVGVDNGALAAVSARVRNLGLTDSVTFAGPAYGADRFAVMRDADVFAITPVNYEETSLASLEAAAAGLPVVATEQADLPGLEAAGGGRIVPRTIDAVAEALSSVVVTREAARVAGARARQLVFDNYSWDAVARQLEEAFCTATRRS
jgi:glycosyltransferase involved in cell wall biosynthesis